MRLNHHFYYDCTHYSMFSLSSLTFYVPPFFLSFFLFFFFFVFLRLNLGLRPDDSTFTAPLLTPDIKAKRGDIVTFSYKAFSRRATPVDPKVVRVRNDLLWEEVLREHGRAPINGNLSLLPPSLSSLLSLSLFVCVPPLFFCSLPLNN